MKEMKIMNNLSKKYTNGDIVVDEDLMLLLTSDILWEEVQKEIDKEMVF